MKLKCPPAGYPVEFRAQLVNEYESCSDSIKTVAERNGVCENTLNNWVLHKRRTGQVPTGRRGCSGRFTMRDLDFFRERLEEEPSLSLRKLARRWAEHTGMKTPSPMTVRQALLTLGFESSSQADSRHQRRKPKRRPAPRGYSPPPASPPRYRPQHRSIPPHQEHRDSYPSDLTDEQWALLEPLFARETRRGRPRKHQVRELMNALLYMARTGCAWRYLPNDFPPWQAVAKTYYRWRDSGLLEQVHLRLRHEVRINAGKQPAPTAVIIDSQSVKTTEKGGSVASMEERRSREESAIS